MGDVERLKNDNVRLREKCSQLAAARCQSDDAQELQRRLADKDSQIARLEAAARQQGSKAQPAQSQQRLAELQNERHEWEQRCHAAEQRLQALQHQLTETSRRYGGE